MDNIFIFDNDTFKVLEVLDTLGFSFKDAKNGGYSLINENTLVVTNEMDCSLTFETAGRPHHDRVKAIINSKAFFEAFLSIQKKLGYKLFG